MATTTQRKLRILALHGYTSNAYILDRRLGAIRKACKNIADFIVVNGPIRVEPITSLSSQDLDAPSDRSSSIANDPNIPIEEQPRAWWRANEETGKYAQFDETLQYLSNEIEKNGPFDGVFGFSQGACFAAIIASVFEDPSRYPKFKISEKQLKTPLRFCIAVSGFRAGDKSLQSIYPKEGIQIPLLHVLGKADYIVDEDRSKTLSDSAANCRVEFHESGHVIPSQSPWRNFFKDFISSFQNEPYDSNDASWKTIIGPSQRPKGGATTSGDHSEVNSGSNTPLRVQEEDHQEDVTTSSTHNGNKSSL